MPPAVSRYTQHMPTLSNPFPHLNQQQLQQAHLQHPGAPNIHAQNFGGQPGFGGQNPGLFGPSGGNSGLHGGNFGGGGGLGGGGTGLASHAAQSGFHGAGMQQQQHMYDGAMGGPVTKGANSRIREVWKTNLAQEMQLLRSLVDRYPYISMDTEFPGVVARPMGEFTTKASYHYQTLRCNVDLLKIIQLGITLFSMDGDVPPAQALEASALNPGNKMHGYPPNLVVCPCTWQFNFEFSTESDMYNSDSISMLKKQGADFEKHATAGIDPMEFGSLLITSGMALADNVTWLSFHSGYDFAYLVKVMWAQQLPNDEEKYRKLVQIFFPNLYDVKFLLRHAQRLLSNPGTRSQISQAGAGIISSLGTKSGLQDLADELGCQRTGLQHTAGSDAWLTGQVFWQMRTKVFEGVVPEDMNGQMWGLTGVGAPASATTQAAVLAAAHQGVNGQGNAMGQGSMMGFHTGATPTMHRGEPSTPTTQQASLVGQSGTPNPPGVFGGHQHHGHGGHAGQGMGMTPHGGVFGQFQHPGSK